MTDCSLIAAVRCKYPQRQLCSSDQYVKAVVTHFVSPQHFCIQQHEQEQVGIISEKIFYTFCGMETV